MQVSELLAQRRKNWHELEKLCEQMGSPRLLRKRDAATVVRFGALYRAACADLALADAYHLPPNTVQYLHQLVGRAHNQLYRRHGFNWQTVSHYAFREAPRRIFRDPYVHFGFLLFWLPFLLSAAIASLPDVWPKFAESVVGADHLAMMEANFSSTPNHGSGGLSTLMSGFYLRHNTSIGLTIFCLGLLVLPGVLATMYQGVVLGTSFGYMALPARGDASDNFFHFVTAHGPFELAAVALASGAGLRLGMAIFDTRGFARMSSLRRALEEAAPVLGCAVALFFMAAFIEGFISPSNLPYAFKAIVALLTSAGLVYYFVVLGFPAPGEDSRAD